MFTSATELDGNLVMQQFKEKGQVFLAHNLRRKRNNSDLHISEDTKNTNCWYTTPPPSTTNANSTTKSC
jgi:hypothetical protein